jgi:outer membrane protein OmpA-like peptidoglycan-associated protein
MKSKKDNYWIVLADLMTVLMVIFLFIAISYMVIIKEENDKSVKDKEKVDKMVTDYQNSKVALLKELNTEFKDDFKKTKWNAVLDSTDLSIKFIDERILFDNDKSDLKPEFKNILSDFFPRYLKIIMKPKYIDKIAEVRVEGHTSPIGEYIHNLELSQDRTRNVIAYLRTLKYYQNQKPDEKERLQYWLTANGLSYGRTLDKNGNLTHKNKLPPDNEKCRRVEFKIVTKTDELINEQIEQLNK